MPHWQAGGATYFITWNAPPGESLDERERYVVLDCIQHFHEVRYRVFLAVVMPDHVHLLMEPLQLEAKRYWALEVILKGMKGVSARRINKRRQKTGSVWQDESYDHVIRSLDDWREKWHYIWNNPEQAGLVKDSSEYPWIWIPQPVAEDEP